MTASFPTGIHSMDIQCGEFPQHYDRNKFMLEAEVYHKYDSLIILISVLLTIHYLEIQESFMWMETG